MQAASVQTELFEASETASVEVQVQQTAAVHAEKLQRHDQQKR